MNSDPKNRLTNAEVERRERLEAMVQRVLDADVDVGPALAHISDARLYRDTHQTFATYLRERWGAGPLSGHQLSQPAEPADRRAMDIAIPTPTAVEPTRAPAPSPGELSNALTNIWEQACHELGGEDVSAVEIHVMVGKRHHPAEAEREPRPTPYSPAEPEAEIRVRPLRWLLTQASGTLEDVVHQVETQAADLGDDAREQLSNDLRVVKEELDTLMTLLFAPGDWDAEYGRLLAGEIPPFEGDAEQQEEE